MLLLTGVFVSAARAEKPSPEIVERSRQYIRELSPLPLESLSLEDKLLLLHAYHNTGDSLDVLRVRDGLGAAYERLPYARRQAFDAMIEKARKETLG